MCIFWMNQCFLIHRININLFFNASPLIDSCLIYVTSSLLISIIGLLRVSFVEVIVSMVCLSPVVTFARFLIASIVLFSL